MLNTSQIINLRKQNKHTNDTIVFGPMSPEKPNAGKLVQLSEGFFIKKFQGTIWVPNPAYPTENALGSSTSQSEIDISLNLPHEIS